MGSYETSAICELVKSVKECEEQRYNTQHSIVMRQ